MPSLNPLLARQKPGTAARAALMLALLASVGCLPGSQGVRASHGEGTRALFVVHLPNVPAWQDFAFLAAVPAATVRCEGAPALLALDESGAITREMDDFIQRYNPQALYCLGPLPREAPTARRRRWHRLDADSADEAARLLARTFWDSADATVVCREGDYGMALVASALAARLRAPLLFSAGKNVPAETTALLKELAVEKAIVVGSVPEGAAALRETGLTVVELKDAAAALTWMREQKIAVAYLAVANPLDRQATVIKRLSLAAPLLAAAREGIALPLPYKTVWKAPFVGAECKGNPPKGTPESRKPPRMGRTSVNGHPFTFVVTSGKHKKDYFAVNVDLNQNGHFSEEGEGPFHTGDVLTLGDRRYSLTLGQKNGAGKADVRLTSPTAAQVIDDLKAFYAAMGGPPEYLCIVGFPDAIPHALVRDRKGSNRDLPSDFPFANTDDDLFAEVAVGRLIAEKVTFATLYASRVLTYDQLLDPSWSTMAGQARWENSYAKLFENVGFTMVPHHDTDTLRWIEKPTDKRKGKRAKAIGPDSPLTHVAVLTHQAHSWWHELGQTYDWESDVLLAPTLVESGGCLTTALDRQPDFRSVVARLMRNGAVGFLGHSLPSIAYQEQQRLVFWNAVLEGETIGRAHRKATNSAAAVVLETNQLAGGPNYFQLHIRGLFGDPAFALHPPSPPKSAPARVEVKDNRVSVHAPVAWWPVRIRVPEDWKKWKDKDLYVLRGAGTYPNRHWIGAGYDAEETYVDATFRTERSVKRIEQVQSPPEPLGWTGQYVVDEHADGTRTYRWRVRLADFDQPKGKILSAVDRLDYRIVFED